MDQPQTDLRVMVDANILIAGSVWPRWSYEVLQHALRGDFRLVLSKYIIQQAHRRILVRFPAYIDSFDALLQTCQYEIVADPAKELVDRYGDLVRDQTDVPIILAAINAGVDYLVSEDKDLTSAKPNQSLTVMISGTFLRQVMGRTSEELERIRYRTWRDIRGPEEM